MAYMPLREACIETSVVIDLFDPRDRDFSGLRLMKTLHAHELQLIIPELAFAQALVGKPEHRYTCLSNMIELAGCAGTDWFTIGAAPSFMRDTELARRDHAVLPRTARYQDALVVDFFERMKKPANFDPWHASFVADARRDVAKVGWRGLDDDVHRLGMTGAFGAGFPPNASQPQRASWLGALLTHIATNPRAALDKIDVHLPDVATIERIALNPGHFPFLVALAYGTALNQYGAAANLKGHHEYDFLSIQDDSWTDIRILAESAYADVFVTKDGRLRKKAELIAGWGYFRPRICSWQELCPS